MTAETETLISFVILPLLAAQLFIMAAIYFNYLGRQVIAHLVLFNCFIATFVCYLLGMVAQQFLETQWAYAVLYIRIALLFIIGLPSLTLFLYQQCGILVKPLYRHILFIFSALMSIVYIVCADASHQNMLLADYYQQIIPFTVTGANHRDAEMLLLICVNLLPICWLLLHESSEEKRKTCLALLVGAILLVSTYIIGLAYESYWIYYVGAMCTAIFWTLAVYQDIQKTKNQAQHFKEELQRKLHRQHYQFQLSLDKKMRVVRQPNFACLDARKRSEDQQTHQSIVTKESNELTSLICQLPLTRSEQITPRVKQHIAKHFQEHIDIAELAIACNVSQSYLVRCFKKDTGQTIKQYLNQFRVNQAKKLLANLTVADVAFAVGFNDSNYFTTVFKKITGVAPLRYKKENYP
ncbi:helix-turn-helix transcriptional regulator [Catenovulum agarivorans]|uniref:helix-turn-helix transcriptional regulator n=1 Tax=Catenovulum agarivorans TaxID=1172192 RepID=UPI0002EA7478|nr:AraC family transcriptional regulator [Catenovulum agarivorans]